MRFLPCDCAVRNKAALGSSNHKKVGKSSRKGLRHNGSRKTGMVIRGHGEGFGLSV